MTNKLRIMAAKTRVSIIGTNGIPARYGGFETLAEHLAEALSGEFDLAVYCARTPRRARRASFKGARLVYIPFRANGGQSMIYDAVSILHSYLTSDVLMILGFSGVAAFPLKRLFGKKIVFNIGGIEWQKVRGHRLSAGLEVAAKKWFERVCVRNSDVVVVDNKVLEDYVRERYGAAAVLAEYGGDHAVAVPATDALRARYPFLAGDYDVSISRAQEDMNIHVLIEAYAGLPGRNLVVVSNWGISEYGRRLKRETCYPNITLQDAVYDLDEINAIRSNARLYIHSHSLCGTAPSLAEAMSLGLPILCYDVATNRATTEGRSRYFQDAPSLRAVLTGMDEASRELLGRDMREIARRRYSWERIVGLYRRAIL